MRPVDRAAPGTRAAPARPSLLSYIAYCLDPDNAKLIREALVVAAGGREALADDGRWGRVRTRRVNKATPSGKIPLPSDVQRRINLHQQASAGGGPRRS